MGDGVCLSWGLPSSGVRLRFLPLEGGGLLLGSGLLLRGLRDLLSSRSRLLFLLAGDLDGLAGKHDQVKRGMQNIYDKKKH